MTSEGAADHAQSGEPMRVKPQIMVKLCLIGSLMLCVACGRSATGSDADSKLPPKQRPLPVTGNCQNENVEGTCRFLIAGRVGSQPSKAPPGTTLYHIEHEIEVRGEQRKINVTSAYLRIPDEYADRLNDYYRKNSPTPCKAYIVRPPCNPQGTSVSLGVEPPEFAVPERY